MEMINAELINVVGFPIAVCIALFYIIREMSKNHKETILEFKRSVDQNTIALNQLINKIDRDGKQWNMTTHKKT